MPCVLAEGAKSQKKADCAVVFFSSHALGGARTHYRMLSMLSVDQPTVSLNAVRVPGIQERVSTCLGQDSATWLKTSINHIGSALRGIYFGGSPQLYRLVVCPEKLASLKRSSVASSSGGQQFVSTNDILTSCLSCRVGAAVTHMGLDLKRRFLDIRDDDVGNYEATVLLDFNSVKTPLAVRAAVQSIGERCALWDKSSDQDAAGSSPKVGGTVLGRKKPLAVLPAWWKFMFTRHAKITNWVAVTKDLVLPGCQQVCHSPTCDDPAKMNSMLPYDLAVVFQINPGQTGVAVMSRSYSKQEYVRALPVVDFGHDFE